MHLYVIMSYLNTAAAAGAGREIAAVLGHVTVAARRCAANAGLRRGADKMWQRKSVVKRNVGVLGCDHTTDYTETLSLSWWQPTSCDTHAGPLNMATSA